MIKKDDNMDKTRRLALTSLLFAMALILSIVENSLPPILVTVPGVKFGLSNIAVMYALFFLRKKEAFSIAILKSYSFSIKPLRRNAFTYNYGAADAYI